MTSPLYDASIPMFIRSLGSMATFLEKGRAFADANGMPHTALLDARLIDDMDPLIKQVQRASDAAKFTPARLCPMAAPAMPDTETSFDALGERIAATIAFLNTVAPEAMAGREDAEVVLPTPNRSFTFTGKAYLFEFAVPNFFFHMTTAYALLRMKGVPVGKIDFLGGL